MYQAEAAKGWERDRMNNEQKKSSRWRIVLALIGGCMIFDGALEIAKTGTVGYGILFSGIVTVICAIAIFRGS